MDPLTLVLALMAAGGVFVAFLGVTALRPRVSIEPGAKESFMQRLEKLLYQAGWDVTPQEFLSMVFFSSLLGGIGVLALSHSIPLGLMGGVLGALAVLSRLESKKEEARLRFQLALPELATIFYDVIASGGDITRAFSQAAISAPEAVRRDMADATRMLQTGVPLEEVIRELGKRHDDPDYWAFLDTLHTFFKEGGRILTVLSTLEETMRERNNVRERVRAEQQGLRNQALLLALSLRSASSFSCSSFTAIPVFFSSRYDSGTASFLLTAI